MPDMHNLEDLDDCFAVASLGITPEFLDAVLEADHKEGPKDAKEAAVHYFVYEMQGKVAPKPVLDMVNRGEMSQMPAFNRIRHYSMTPLATTKRHVTEYGEKHDEKHKLLGKEGHGGLCGVVSHAADKALAKRCGMKTVGVSKSKPDGEAKAAAKHIRELKSEIKMLKQEKAKLQATVKDAPSVQRKICEDLAQLCSLAEAQHATNRIVESVRAHGVNYLDHVVREEKQSTGVKHGRPEEECGGDPSPASKRRLPFAEES